MLSKFLDPKNYVAFKRVFGLYKNQDILIHFLNDVIVFKEKIVIQEVSFLQSVRNPELAASKESIVDVLCTDAQGNKYIVQMQVDAEEGFEKNAQNYAYKAYISQIKVGSPYQDLKAVIFLAIVNYEIFPDKKGYKTDHVILDAKTYEHDLKDFSFTFIELPKFTNNIDQLTNLLEKWCYFFKYAAETKESDLKKIVGSDAILERAYEELNRYSWNEAELLTYDQAEKYQWAYRASMEKKFEEGIEKGKAETMHEVARSLLKIGVPISDIAITTHLSEDEIRLL